MRIYKMFMRNLVNYPWIGPDVVVVVIEMGRFKFITSNYENRPDKLLEYKPTIHRWGSDWLPNWMQLPKDKLRNPQIMSSSLTPDNSKFFQYWDSGLSILDNMKQNMMSQKEFDLMIHNYPEVSTELIKCNHCSGTGEEDIFDLEKNCHNCNGEGWINPLKK